MTLLISTVDIGKISLAKYVVSKSHGLVIIFWSISSLGEQSLNIPVVQILRNGAIALLQDGPVSSHLFSELAKPGLFRVPNLAGGEDLGGVCVTEFGLELAFIASW